MRHNKAKGIPPAAHVGCELILWMAGVSIGSVWISITYSYMHDSYFTSGESIPGLTGATMRSWASVTYFWGAVVLVMA